MNSKKTNKAISRLLIIFSLTMLICCSALGINKSSDNNLYTKVMEKLKFEPSIDESNITIAIKNEGVIVLGGKVESYTEKRLAEIAVEKIATVKGVANEIEVDLLLSYRRSDVEIIETALEALKWTVKIPYKKIKVAVDNGWLTLTGEVEYNYQKEYAENAIENLYGVVAIINDIKIKPVVAPSAVKKKIIKEFERNARIDASNIQVFVDGSKVTLRVLLRTLMNTEKLIQLPGPYPV